MELNGARFCSHGRPVPYGHRVPPTPPRRNEKDASGLAEAPTVMQFLAVAGVPMVPRPFAPSLPAATSTTKSWFSHRKRSMSRAFELYTLAFAPQELV